MPANGRERVLKARVTDSATEKIPLGSATGRVRVKRCGKSAPRFEQSNWQGKPHVKQDQIGEEEWPAPLQLPGRSLELLSNERPRGMVATLCGAIRAGNKNRLTGCAGFVLQAVVALWFTAGQASALGHEPYVRYAAARGPESITTSTM